MKKPSKEAIERMKTIVITVFITALVAFLAGINYEKQQQAVISSAIKQAAVVETTASPKK